jgi:hypothetical protein
VTSTSTWLRSLPTDRYFTFYHRPDHGADAKASTNQVGLTNGSGMRAEKAIICTGAADLMSDKDGIMGAAHGMKFNRHLPPDPSTRAHAT